MNEDCEISDISFFISIETAMSIIARDTTINAENLSQYM